MTAYDFEKMTPAEQSDLWSRWTDEAKARVLRTALPDSAARKLADVAGWDRSTPPAHPDELEWDPHRLTWLYPPPPPEPRRVPLRIFPRQLWLALLQRGITRAMVDGIIDSLPSPQKEIAQVEWETAGFYERTHPLIGQIGAALELSETDIDDVFVEGEGL